MLEARPCSWWLRSELSCPFSASTLAATVAVTMRKFLTGEGSAEGKTEPVVLAHQASWKERLFDVPFLVFLSKHLGMLSSPLTSLGCRKKKKDKRQGRGQGADGVRREDNGCGGC